MKSCPTCHRSYADDTLLYCLEDGAQLFTPRSAQETLRMPGARDTEPPATEILPHGYQRPAVPNSATWPAQIQAGAVPPTAAAGGTVPPALTDPRFSSPQPLVAPKPARSNGAWIAVSAVLAVIVLGMVGVVGFMLLSGDSKIPNANVGRDGSVVIGNDNNPYPANNSNDNDSNTASNTNAPVNSNNGSTTNANIPASGQDWLSGTWTGTGHQPDGESWVIRITFDYDQNPVVYPSLKCTGTWKQEWRTTTAALFTETIVNGANCISGGQARVDWRSDGKIDIAWIYSGIEGATATLTRK